MNAVSYGGEVYVPGLVQLLREIVLGDGVGAGSWKLLEQLGQQSVYWSCNKRPLKSIELGLIELPMYDLLLSLGREGTVYYYKVTAKGQYLDLCVRLACRTMLNQIIRGGA